MGFLSDLIRRFTKKATQRTAEKVADKMVDKVFNKSQGTSTYQDPTNQDYSYESKKVERIDLPSFFNNIFATYFPEYEVVKDVPVSNIGPYTGKPYTFGLYQNGYLQAVVMLTEHNKDNNRAFLNARNACKEANIPFINFYTHFSNKEDYVCERIKSFLE